MAELKEPTDIDLQPTDIKSERMDVAMDLDPEVMPIELRPPKRKHRRNWQSGVRFTTKVGVTGTSIDKNAECLYMDEEVIIMRPPGGYVEKNEQRILAQDQTVETSKAVRAMVLSKRLQTPIGVIIGNQNTILKQTMPHRFSVMDFFIITDMWHEKVGKFAAVNVRQTSKARFNEKKLVG
ncbi:2OG-Fe(II) oxygenase superfamily-domain-containing protein [Penicillium angulare]|uniref:2OG-Fe(II) oxygenase superfamily-domain-containing protein n=1 Tax=Penicillium angulare TaxID=116970 RepID=UPI002540A7FE|nr:2OG-Fe(II) oxygenase superfamily-domain-containing protein [Penicillium angulare]KAJ5272433.1 2OG-Fe(II) oxygenase superfamily-domain-containing protein [Penicillium angulare]